MAGAAIGAGTSILGSLLGRPRTSTQKSTSSTTIDPVYGPKGQKLAGVSARTLIDFIKNPRINEGLRIQGREEIGDVYNAQGSRLDSILARRGFGNSGKANLNTVQLEQGRAQALAGHERKLYQDALDRQFQALGLGTAYGRPIGFNTTTEGTGTTPGMPFGQALGGAIGNAGGDIAAYLQLQDLLKRSQA